jgi:hypothetical protein
MYSTPSPFTQTGAASLAQTEKGVPILMILLPFGIFPGPIFEIYSFR